MLTSKPCWLQGGALRRLSFVDLAGSERAGRTGNHGARLRYEIRNVEPVDPKFVCIAPAQLCIS